MQLIPWRLRGMASESGAWVSALLDDHSFFGLDGDTVRGEDRLPVRKFERREGDVLLVQITISAGRSLEMKEALYARMVGLLAESPGIRKQDLFVSLIEVAKENWSFGNGVAQYA